MTSPPPGLPVTSDLAALDDFIMHRRSTLPPPAPSSQVIDYLRHSGVEYLIFQRGPGSTWYLREPVIPDHPFALRVNLAAAFVFHKALLDMIKHCPKLYDDGDVVVLEVGTSSSDSKQSDSSR